MQHHPENGNKLVYSSSEEYLYFSNTSTVFNMSGESVDSADEQQSMVLLTCYIIMACVGTCLNFLVIYVVVLKLLRDHKKPGNCAHLLVAHLSAVSICLAVVTPFNTSDQVYFIPVSGPNCSWVVYMKSVFLCCFSMNVVLITFERLQAFGENQKNWKLWSGYLIMFIWLFSLIFNIPTATMTKSKASYQKFKDNDKNFVGNCVTTNLRENPVKTIIYETFRFAVFHGAVVIYMVYGLVKVRSCLRYLYTTSASPSETTLRKIRSVRLICYHFLTFILIWLPAGLLVFLRRVLNRVDPNDSLVKGISGYIASAVPVYVLINPLISLLLLESNLSNLCCYGKHTWNSKQEQLSDGCANGNTSRISTAAFSKSSEDQNVELKSVALDIHTNEEQHEAMICKQ